MAEVTNSEVKEAHHLYQNFNSQRDWVQEFVEWRRQHEEQLYKNMSEEHGYQRGFERGLHDGQLAGFEAGHHKRM